MTFYKYIYFSLNKGKEIGDEEALVFISIVKQPRTEAGNTFVL